MSPKVCGSEAQLPHSADVGGAGRIDRVGDRAVRISKTAGSPLQEVWFDQITVQFNYDLVAIIGNKGSGKSALADILGLLGHSKRDKYFSFLNDEKFRDPRANKSKYFEATVEFVAGSPARGRLDSASDPSAVPLLRYLPQNYIERLCNEIAAGPSTDFDRELKTIIFSHVPDENRLGMDSLDAVVAYRTDLPGFFGPFVIGEWHPLRGPAFSDHF